MSAGTRRCSYARMRFEAKGWYEAERGLHARGGPDAWRGNRRPGAGAIELRDRGEWVSFDGFVLPSVPENWADLPFKLTASQTVSYNSNISSFPIGVAPRGAVLGDFTTTTNFGFSTRANVSGQQLFLDATFGVIRYLHDVQFNSTVYSLNAGVDWNVTSRCSGALAASLSKSPGELTEQVGTGVNYTTTTALNETGKCAVSNGYSLVFNSGLTTLTNSDAVNALNDARTELIAAGIEYAKGVQHSHGAGQHFRSELHRSNRGAGCSRIGHRDRLS